MIIMKWYRFLNRDRHGRLFLRDNIQNSFAICKGVKIGKFHCFHRVNSLLNHRRLRENRQRNQGFEDLRLKRTGKS